MTKKKPDRFERMAGTIKTIAPSGNYYKEVFVRDVVKKLLRQEHQAVVRMLRAEIKKHRKVVASTVIDTPQHQMSLARWEEADYILDQLEQRAT